MKRLEHITQPHAFRGPDERPAWMHVPKLNLLLGWGDGLRETLGKGYPAAVRNVFVPVWDIDGFEDPVPYPFGDFIDALYAYFAGREVLPFIRVISARHCLAAWILPQGEVEWEATEHGLRRTFVEDQDYRIRLDAARVRLERRSKRLKPMFAEIKDSFERTHSTVRPPGKKRSAAEHGFAEVMDTLKRHFHVERKAELLTRPDLRPADFDEIRMTQLRTRTGELQRGKNGDDGLPKRPFTDEELLERTCHAIADREANDLTFDYAWNEVACATPDGVTLTA